MAATDYEILKVFLNTDDIPSPNMCPCICLLPISKAREITRIGGNAPYNTLSTFEVQCWSISLDGYENAFKLVTEIEENVFNMLTKDVGIVGRVKTSIINDTQYEYDIYDSTYYMVAKIQITVHIDQ